ncbi:MAG TPA: ABC transporter ATP-binding protein [Streptosporangiaceae bacterium]
MSSSPALRVTGLHLSFGPVKVLTGISLAVAAESFTAVLGTSGSGKTTLLRAIAGFERPDAGTIELAGRTADGPGRHLPPERRQLGYVTQEGALFPHLTVGGNVGFGLRRRERTAARIDELLELVDLAGLRRRYPHELSGGQQQRVALARALALRPALVLLDEPFASLDAALRLSVRADIARVLRAARATVVLVTHDQQEALSLADQVAVLRHGQIAQTGSPRQLYAQPADPEMAGFLGEANLVRAQVRGTDAVTALGTLQTGPVPSGGAMALIRPEQITIGNGQDAGSGMPATVAGQVYQGPDSMITFRPGLDCGTEVIRVRVLGGAVLPPGTEVRLHATGYAPTWPAASDLRRRLRRPPQVVAGFETQRAEQPGTERVIGCEIRAGVAAGRTATGSKAVIDPHGGASFLVVQPVRKVTVAEAVAHFGQPGGGEADTLGGVLGEHQPVNLQALSLEMLILDSDVTAGIAIRYHGAIGEGASANAEFIAGRGAYLEGRGERGSADGDGRGNAQRQGGGDAHKTSSHVSAPSDPGWHLSVDAFELPELDPISANIKHTTSGIAGWLPLTQNR